LPERAHCTVKTPRDLGFFFFLHTIETRRTGFRKLAIAMILHGLVLIIRGAVNGLCICETKACTHTHTHTHTHTSKSLKSPLQGSVFSVVYTHLNVVISGFFYVIIVLCSILATGDVVLSIIQRKLHDFYTKFNVKDREYPPHYTSLLST
jgi:hypothetical protein